ncbi:hypothetical protein BGX29_010629 [Mortierella sp. GBA35]|nr:hypothetical protein BGX29_010629 [Mortierella sp. GBA35]
MLLQQVCPGKTCASLQSIHSASYQSRRYILYAATDSVVICDDSFKPIQILFLQRHSKENQNQIVSAVVMSEFDGKACIHQCLGKIAVTTDLHVLLYAPKTIVSEGHLLTGGDHLTLWAQQDSQWTQVWQQRQGSCIDLIQFSPDGKLFASMAKNDRLVKIWHQHKGEHIDFGFFYLPHPRAVTNFSWRKEKTSSTSLDDPINVLFTMARDGICRIWSPLILLQPESMSICAIIDPNQWLVSQQQSITQYPIHALDGMEFAMAVEYAASKTVDKNNDANSIRLRKLKEIVRDTSDLFFQIQGDGSMIIWGVQNLGKVPQRLPRVLLVLRISQSVTPLETAFFMRNIIAYHDTALARSRGTRDVKLVTPAWEGGSFMVYDGARITLYTAEDNATCTAILDLPDYDPEFPLILLDSFEIPFLVEEVSPSGKKTTNVSWRRYILGFSTKNNTVFTWQRTDDGHPVLFSKENLPPSTIKHAVTVESFAGTLPNDGTCDLEIWGSVGGRAIGRLETKFARLPAIYDLDWMVTADARHNLAVAFENTVAMYSQQRTEVVTSPTIWERFLSINIPSFVNHPISSIAWLDMGTLSVGAGGTMLLYSKWLSEDYVTIAPGFEEFKWAPTLQHALSSMHGPLVDYHPNLLFEFFMWGKFEVVRKILFNLYHYMSYVNESNDTSTGPLPIPLEVILKTDVAAKTVKPDHNDLFASEDDFKSSDESKFLNDRTSKDMIEFLTRVSLVGLSKNAQLQLSAFIEGFAKIDKQHGTIDDNGLRFLLHVRRFNYLSYILSPAQRPTMLSFRDITWAYHSESQDLLLDFCVNSLKVPMTWPEAKSLGLFLWMRKKDAMIKQMEVIARNQYSGKDDKDPVACTLFYIALKKKKLLHGLWRTAHGHAEQGKMVTFLSNDFEQDRWRTAALKNAFALLGKQRFAYAAAFFLLGDKLQDAVNVCVKHLNDIQLAISLCRVYEQGKRTCLDATATGLGEDYNGSMASQSVLLHARPDRKSYSSDPETSPIGPDSGQHRDPAMLILYRHLRKNAHHFSGYEGDEEFSAVVRAAEAYEHYGCPLLSLVILKHWGYVMPVDGASKNTRKVRNILEVRRESITSLPRSTSMSFRSGLRSAESSSNFDNGMLNFDDFGTLRPSESTLKNEVAQKEQEQKPNGMSLMGGFRSGPPAGSEVNSGTFDFDSFGGGNKNSKSNGNGGGMSLMSGFKSTVPSSDVSTGTFDFDSFGSNSTSSKQNSNGTAGNAPKSTGMSLMGGFKMTAPSSDVNSGTFDFDSFGSSSASSKQNGDATPKSTGMSLIGGFKSAAPPSNFDSGILDFDTFGSTSNTSKPGSRSSNQARDIFAGFAPPADDGLRAVSKANGGGGGTNGHYHDEHDVQGSEELLNDYITTLVVQLLTPMASALRTVSLKPELLVAPVFKGYVENIKYGWDKLSEHANVSSVVMEQALISKCIEVDTLPVCFHWLNTTMSTGSPISAIVSHYSESCYSMVGIILTERLTTCMKSHIKEYARSVLESSSEWFNLAKTVIKTELALPRWEQMVLASYIMLVIMSLQEQDYAVLSGMLFQWRRFSGFVVGDRGGAVKVIAEVLGGNLYSPLDANAISSDFKDNDGQKSERESLQEVILNAATTNALVMSLEGLLRDHGHRMSDETRKFITSSFLERLNRSGIEQEKTVIQMMKNSPLQDHLRGYLNNWQKKYWVLLSGLESGGHLLPQVSAFLEANRQCRDSPPAPVEDTTLLYKTRSVITSFSFNPVEKRIVAVCSRTDIIEIDISKALDFQKNLNMPDAEHSDMDSEMDFEDEEVDEGDFLDAQGNVIDRTGGTSNAPSMAESTDSNISRAGSQASLQTVFKNLFSGKAKHHEGAHHHHHHGLAHTVTDSNLRRSQGLAPGDTVTGVAGTKTSSEVDNIVVRSDVVATCSESHPSFPLYLTGHNPALDYPCVTLWQFGQPRELNNYAGTSAKLTRVHFDSYGQKFGATDIKGDMHLWRFDSNVVGSKPFLTLHSHDKIARDFAFLGSSSVIATTGTSGDGRNLAIWDTLLPPEKARTQSYNVHNGGGYSLAFSKRHQLLVSGGRNGEICIFDIRQPKLLHTIQAHEMHVRSLYIDEAGLTLCSGSGEGDMKAWNLETFEPLSSFENLQARNRFQFQTFDRIPVKAYGVTQIAATKDYFYSCGPSGFIRAKRK